MDAGETIDLDVTGAAHGGVFVARVPADDADTGGRVVFVPDAIPGERVRVRLTDTRKSSFWRGDVLEVLDASPHRRPHVWRPADVEVAPELRPGGADFGHIALDHQRELKVGIVRDALERIGGVELPVTIEPAQATREAAADPAAPETDDGLGWRTRVSLHVDDDGRIGPYAARSHRVIPVDDLPLATPAIAAAARGRHADGPGRIDLIEPADGRVRVISRPEPPRAAGVPGRGGRRGGPRRGGRAPAVIDPAARETIIETVGGREFRLDAGGFWQVHRGAAATLTAAVTGALEGLVDPEAEHLDLYGGVGLLAAAVAEAGGTGTRITTVESDARATEHAGENLAEWVGARAETGRVDRWLAALAASASPAQRARLSAGAIVLDPPRAGAGRDVVDLVAGLRPARVVYVACDPVALARDLRTFGAHGYAAADVRAFDLFPHSHHVEAVAVLSPIR